MRRERHDSDDTNVPVIIPGPFCSQENCDLLLAGLMHTDTSSLSLGRMEISLERGGVEMHAVHHGRQEMSD